MRPEMAISSPEDGNKRTATPKRAMEVNTVPEKPT
jgi:hypothetical protein